MRKRRPRHPDDFSSWVYFVVTVYLLIGVISLIACLAAIALLIKLIYKAVL